MWKLSEDQKSQAVTMYLGGASSVEIAGALGVSCPAILGLLRRRSVLIRTMSECQRRLSYDNTAFADATEDAAYWAGFLMADGSVVGNEIALVLSSKDRSHVENFRDFLRSDHALIDTGHATVRFSIRCEKLVSDLARFGVVARKTHTAKAILVDRSPHFWRGVVDGDGSIGISRRGNSHLPRLELVGSKNLMLQFADFVRQTSPGCTATVKPHKSIYRVGLLGLHAGNVINKLYSCKGIALTRKANAALNILRSGRNTALQATGIPGL